MNLDRTLFWQHVVQRHNFKSDEERQVVVSLVHKLGWIHDIPEDFTIRHTVVFSQISDSHPTLGDLIQRDVIRTFSIFHSSDTSADLETQQRPLYSVLNAVAEAENGYCQGMNFIAAVLLVEELTSEEAYVVFLFALQMKNLSKLFKPSFGFLNDFMLQFEAVVRKELPQIDLHMKALGFHPVMYCVEWFTTMFSCSTKLLLTQAIFDLFFRGLDNVFIRVGVAILQVLFLSLISARRLYLTLVQLLEDQILSMDLEHLLQQFKRLVKELDPYEVILRALAISSCSSRDLLGDLQHRLVGKKSKALDPNSYKRHRTLHPEFKAAIKTGDLGTLMTLWNQVLDRYNSDQAKIIANEILHYCVWYGKLRLAEFAIESANAHVNAVDQYNLTPLHFSVLRNYPDLTRLLLSSGADPLIYGGHFTQRTPLDLGQSWIFCDTTASCRVLRGCSCVCCNAAFHWITRPKRQCDRCGLYYCNQQQKCISTHRCTSREVIVRRRNV